MQVMITAEIDDGEVSGTTPKAIESTLRGELDGFEFWPPHPPGQGFSVALFNVTVNVYGKTDGQ